MSNSRTGNLLLVSNYSSETAYAWWLMEQFWASIAEHFATSDCKVYLAYPEVTAISETIANSTIEVIEITIPWSTSSQSSRALQFIREKDISFIYFTDQRYFNLHYAIMRFYGVRHIVVHDHTPGDRPPVHGIKGALKASINWLPWMTADRVLCVSPLMRKRNITNARIPKHKCLVVQNGIKPVNCDQNKNITIRKSLGLSNNSLLVTTVGRAHPYKRFDFIIESARQLKIQSPECNVVFLLIGDGPAIPQLEEQIRKHNLEDIVKLLGFRNDVHDILCISDIAMHAALGEGFSLSIIEYMSASLPVLVPNITSVSQAITHNKTGLIYKKDDPRTAALYIAELANNENHRLAMGKAAKDKANARYRLDQCIDSLISAIEEVYYSDSQDQKQ